MQLYKDVKKIKVLVYFTRFEGIKDRMEAKIKSGNLLWLGNRRFPNPIVSTPQNYHFVDVAPDRPLPSLIH